MTRLGAVLHDKELIARVAEDIQTVLVNPDWFNASWTKGHDVGGHEAEGWVRSIYSRAMLAYYDYTADKSVLDFLTKSFLQYKPAMSRGERSLTQIEAMLETHAFGGPRALVDTATKMMTTSPSSIHYQQQLLGNCSEAAVTKGSCLNHEHGVTFNELAKLFAMISSFSGNASHLQASVNAYNMVKQFDVQVHGVVSANEPLAGIGPNVGTEVRALSCQ